MTTSPNNTRHNIDSRKNFQQLFYRREGKELLGKGYGNYWILVAILFITFITIGFANGSLDYLSQKMSDPYVNWVSIEIPYGKANEIQSLQKELNSEEIREAYNYKNITSYNTYPLEIWHKEKQKAFNVPGRTLSQEDTILYAVLHKKNLIKGEQNFKSKMDIGVIVTEDFLEQFGYGADTPYILKTTFADSISYTRDSLGMITDSTIQRGARHLFPIPVRAVVKDLPGLNNIAFTPYFYKQVICRSQDNPFNPIFTQNISFFIEDSVKATQFKTAIEKSLQQLDYPTSVFLDEVSPSDNFSSYTGGYKIDVILEEKDRGNFDIQNQIYNSIVEQEEMKSFTKDFIRFYDYSKLGKNTAEAPPMDYISISFMNLDKIRPFKEYLYTKSKLKIDMARVEALENYNFIAKLTYIISFILIAFSIVSICFFVSNLLHNHLKSISMNIGAFKAFGLGNKMLKNIYFKMIAAIFGAAMLLSFLITLVVGNIGGIRFFVNSFIKNASAEHSYFQIFEYSTGFALVVLVSILYFVVKTTTNKILDKSPGDLIYGRT